MKKIRNRVGVFSVLLSISFCSFIPSGPVARGSASTLEDVVTFLSSLQSPSESGLVRIAENVSFTTTYVNAMAAIAFIATGRLDRARAIFDVFASRQDSCGCQCGGGFQQFRDPLTGAPLVTSGANDFWIGDNAWLLTSLKYYRRATSDQRYNQLMQRLVTWFGCIKSQTQGSGIFSGYRKNGELMNFKHPEGSIDVYGALKGLGAESIRTSIREWIDTDVWPRQGSCFKVGPANQFNLPLDNVSWGILALGSEYQCLSSHAEALIARSQDRYQIEVSDREQNWHTDQFGGNPSIYVSVGNERHGENNEMLITYSWNSGDAWLRAFRQRDIDLSATPKFRYFFWMKGDGSGNRFEVKLQNRTGEVFIYDFTMDFSDWRRIEIRYDQFRHFDPSTTAPLGPIGMIEFAVNNQSRTAAVNNEIRVGRIWYEDSGKSYLFAVDGFDSFESEHNWLWLEGTAQMVTAYGLTGQTERYSHYLASLTSSLSAPVSGNGLGLPNMLTGGIDKGVPEAVASCWYIVALTQVNPFDCPAAAGQNGSDCLSN